MIWWTSEHVKTHACDHDCMTIWLVFHVDTIATHYNYDNVISTLKRMCIHATWQRYQSAWLAQQTPLLELATWLGSCDFTCTCCWTRWPGLYLYILLNPVTWTLHVHVHVVEPSDLGWWDCTCTCVQYRHLAYTRLATCLHWMIETEYWGSIAGSAIHSSWHQNVLQQPITERWRKCSIHFFH